MTFFLAAILKSTCFGLIYRVDLASLHSQANCDLVLEGPELGKKAHKFEAIAGCCQQGCPLTATFNISCRAFADKAGGSSPSPFSVLYRTK